mgnify:CR=1 FL=1
MKIEYKRDLQASYLVISGEPEPDRDAYPFVMVQRNEIPSFVPMEKRSCDGQTQIWYRITSLTSLKERYRSRQLRYEQILLILGGLEAASRSAREYLLDARQFLFLPEHLYLDEGEKTLHVCMYPDGNSRMEDLVSLSEWMLRRLDHSDKRAVAAAYRFYQKVTQPNASLGETLREIMEATARFGSDQVQDETAADQPASKKSLFPMPQTGKEKPAGRRIPERYLTKPLAFVYMLVLGGITADLCAMAFGYLDATQAGGLFFALLGAEILGVRHA